MAADDSDEVLMARIAEGDRGAFAQLVGRHLSRTVGLATRLGGSRDEGEEIAQEAFARVWTHAARWRPHGAGGTARFTTWLYRVVVNLAIDRRRRPRAEPIDDTPEPRDDSADAFATVHGREVAAAVREAIAALPERQRQVLVLCFYEGLSNAEAGEILSLSVGAVESLLVRARRSLRARLAAHYAELGEG